MQKILKTPVWHLPIQALPNGWIMVVEFCLIIHIRNTYFLPPLLLLVLLITIGPSQLTPQA